ncbi:GNAT family N-acetyltransferase [Cryobacterium adonitolivorans]|uniref:GNAT family N-acetyltransferase n=1 Tax=Cryobacterium adonitolivorans TaxID=1259189 RepID=A0A4R8W1N6_9MICO|nr:GNAT family N-acetyltransferase [Cryobacterium adonitolivorans]TFB99840.1 GNAT family N-acetyltransferase [Cryobacterium adonitolivorans]
MPGLTFVTTDPGSPAAAATLWAYYDDIVGRYWGRAPLPGETDSAVADEPSGDLQGDTGVLVLGMLDGEPVACGGVRFVGGGVGELTRVYVASAARGIGAGAGLLAHLDVLAARAGITRLRLTVRSDLVEARRLYARCGYLEVAPFNTEPYAEHWFAKELR